MPSIFNHTYITHSIEETKALGKKLMQEVLFSEKKVVAFYGDLGAGKTLFIKGMGEYLQIPEMAITSPTFTYLNIYESNPPLHHFDLYRIENEKTFLEMGFQEYLDLNQFCVIEWAEKIPLLLPKDSIKISFSYLSQNSREIKIEASS